MRSVEPAPDATHLRVVVVAPAARSAQEVAARLFTARPFLRAEVAAAVRRKRAPDLAFVVAHDDVARPEGDV